jgi:hypothetical protein
VVRYGMESKLSPEKVLEEAVTFFSGGLGLELTQQEPCCAQFVGGGGYVSVSVAEGKKTSVDLETREWDFQVRQFMHKIG